MLIKNIIKSETEPSTNCLWLKDNSLYHFNNGKWEELDSTVINDLVLEDNQLIYYTSDNNKLNIVDWAQGSTPGGSDWAYNPTSHIVSHEYNADARYGIITFDTNTIPDGLFVSQPTLLKVDMADNIVFIGAEAFCNCTNLKEIRLSNTLKAIGYAAFYLDSALESIYIPDSVVDMSKNPNESDTYNHGCQFMNCTSLKNVRLSKNMTVIPGLSFNGCTSLISINFPDSVTTIKGYSFTNCINLNNITISKNVTTIGDNNFMDCRSIKTITIQSTKLTSLPNNFIVRCALDIFTVPNSITTGSATWLNVATINNLIFQSTFTHFTSGHNATATLKNIDFSGDSVTNFPTLNNKLESVILRNSNVVTGLDELIPSSIITTKLKIYVPTNLIESYKTTYSYLSNYFFEITGDAFITKKEVESKVQTLSTNINNTTDSKLQTLFNEVDASIRQTTTMLQSDIETVVKEVDGLKYKLGVLQEYHKEPLYTRIHYIVDQRGIITDGDDIISPNYIMNEEGKLVKLSENGATGNPATNLLTWLKLNTHRYVGFDDGNYHCILKQLDDKDSTKYIDGTSALDDIKGADNKDVWVKFPCNVYYKTEAYTPEGETEPNNDYILVTITTKLLDGENEEDWNKWDEYHLIGVYLTDTSIDMTSFKKYSVSNYSLSTGVTSYKLTTKGSLYKGYRYKYLDYDLYKFLHILFYGYYSTTNCNNTLGTKCTSNITGLSNNLGMQDSIYDANNDDKVINFWGIENLYGNRITPILNTLTMLTTDPNGTSTNFASYVTGYLNNHNNVLITDENGTDTLYESKEDVIAKYNGTNENKFIAITTNENDFIISRLIHISKKCFISNKIVYKMLFGKHSDIIAKEITSYNYEMFNHSNDFRNFSVKEHCTFKNFNEFVFRDSVIHSALGLRVMFLGDKTSVFIQN